MVVIDIVQCRIAFLRILAWGNWGELGKGIYAFARFLHEVTRLGKGARGK